LKNSTQIDLSVVGEALEHLPSAHLILDHSLSIVTANSKAQALLGKHSLAGQSFSSLVIDSDFNLTYDQLLAAQAQPLRYKLKDQDSSVEMILAPLSGVENGQFLIGEIKNIDSIIALETSLERQRLAAAASAKLAALGEMAGSVAHEINNPLAILMAASRVLSRSVEKGKLTEELVLKLVGDIDSTLERISKIVTGLRTTTRESDNVVLVKIQLRELFDEVISLCREKFKTRGIELRADLSNENFDQFILGDRVQLSQVFINLLGNAFDAVESLDQRWVEVLAIKAQDGNIEVRLIDSGSGIERSVSEKMFTPFFTSKPVGKGTGLGLSISQNIIHKNGGQIWIDNDHPNTCFVIALKQAAA
tara:strand:- start:1190 stop:2278 length:1089 start_codon:yes stop_codon:yes gene_type:complete